MKHEPVFVMGAGRAGTCLARALRGAGVLVAGLHGRHAPGGPDGVTVGPLPESIRNAAVILVAVRDSQIDDALRELLAARPAPRSVVVHASGSVEPEMLTEVRAAGHPVGPFHPLVPLSDPARAADALRGAYIGVDGDEEARIVSMALAAKLGAHTLDIPPGEKARYHAAAVFASNFPAVLAALAGELMRSTGVSTADARGAVTALLRASVANLHDGEPAHVLTGPIARGDAATVRAHLAALSSDDRAIAIYRALSAAAVDLLATDPSTDHSRLAEIAAVLEQS